LETAVRWNINAVLLINNNRALSQEIDIYTKAYGGQLRGKHAELARTMGADGFQVRKPGELSGALDKAFSSKKPSVVEVMTEMTAVAPLAFLYEDKP
jgi:thiamine pyrophosphate-dependent acetolactate synthase large subunit-like protein